MKWTQLYTAVALLGMVSSALAGGIQQVHYQCGAEKACGCAPYCQPECCKPVICRPTCPKICTYQRDCCKPNCCGVAHDGCCAPKCGPACAPACPPACPTPCCKPVTGCCPTGPACGVGCKPYDNCCRPNCGPACGNAPPACGAAPCCDDHRPLFGWRRQEVCCNVDPCEVAHWIYVSQTACYAKQRAKAIDYLGDHFDCRCSPEIMCAFIYGLNDADERVRYEAAQEIRLQVTRDHCCCSQQVVCALAGALADCDRWVRREAERALIVCGYDVVDCDYFREHCHTGCGPACGQHCGPACGPACCPPQGPATAPATAAPPADAPTTEGTVVPPPEAPKASVTPPVTEPEAYFPSRVRTQGRTTRKGLSNLFGLR